MTRQRLVSGARVLVGLAISALCLVLAFRNVPLDDLTTALAGANYWWLGPAAVAQMLSVIARARRWQVLLLSRAGFVELFWAQAIGFLGTNLFPLRAGEAARVLVASRRAQLPLVGVSASALLERILDVATILAILVALLPIMPMPPAALAAGLALGGALGVILLLVATALLLGDRAEDVVARLTRPLPVRIGELLIARARELVAGLEVVRDPTVLGRALLWSALTWTASIATYWAVIEAIVPGAAPVEPTFAIAAISIGLAVPSSPGFVGIYQFIGQQALVAPFPERYSAVSALSVALLAHMLYYVMTSGLGGLGMLRLGVSIGAMRPTSPPIAPLSG